MTPETVRRVVRASALYDLVLTAPFATPWTAALALGALSDVHWGLGLEGVPPVADDRFAMLFANLLGSIVSVWSIVRLIRPTPFLGAGDAVARLLFSAGFGWALADGASSVLVGFLVIEVAWGLVQALAVWKPLTAARQARGHTLAAC
jgi:hypothetical protein